MVLGLSDDQFYALTPRQYHLMLARHRERVKHTEWVSGVIAAAIANWSQYANPDKTVQPDDFAFPLLRMDKKRQRAPRLNRKKIAADIRAAFDREKQRMKGTA